MEESLNAGSRRKSSNYLLRMADAFGNSVENCSLTRFSGRWHVESAVFWIHFSVDFGQVFMWYHSRKKT